MGGLLKIIFPSVRRGKTLSLIRMVGLEPPNFG